MSEKAKIFKTGRSQAVRLPLTFRFDVPEVYIRRAAGGDVVLSLRPEERPWRAIFNALDEAGLPEDFLQDRDKAPAAERNLA